MNRFNPDLKICYDRIIPTDPHSATRRLHDMRAESVLRMTKRSTLRSAFKDLDPTKPMVAPYAAIIVNKRWPVGSTLKCRFLGGSDVQQGKVLAKAKIWEQFANIRIDVVDTDEHLRIGFAGGQGFWSRDRYRCSRYPLFSVGHSDHELRLARRRYG